MKNIIRTFNASGKCMFEESFETAEAAYKEFEDILNASKHLPKGYTMTVVRYSDEMPMAIVEVVGQGR